MLGALLMAILSAVPAPAESALSDARLNEVCFVDAENGWAVGDRGAIWHTDDGGRQWQLQASGVTYSLRAVQFLTPQIGWAAGGFAHPYTHTSEGVLLVTRDGGQTWTNVPRLGLPALRRLGFFDAQHGWALAYPSAIYPSGVFTTDDGGRSWQPTPGENVHGWLAADFVDGRTGALAGRNQSRATISQGQIEAAKSAGLRNLWRLRLARSGDGWSVGDGDLVQVTADSGTAWHDPPGQLPSAARQFDFAAMAVRGPKCWIGGTPGTRMFHTADAGRTWTAFPTGSRHHCGRLRWSTISMVGQWATWARFWPPLTAGRLGSGSDRPTPVPRCFASLPTPPTCRWS